MDLTKQNRQYFKTLDELYKLRLNAFLATANKFIFNKDYSIDAVHDAFVKATEYFNKNPDKKIRERIIHLNILRVVKRYNKKYSPEIPWGLFRDEDKGDID